MQTCSLHCTHRGISTCGAFIKAIMIINGCNRGSGELQLLSTCLRSMFVDCLAHIHNKRGMLNAAHGTGSIYNFSLIITVIWYTYQPNKHYYHFLSSEYIGKPIFPLVVCCKETTYTDQTNTFCMQSYSLSLIIYAYRTNAHKPARRSFVQSLDRVTVAQSPACV